MQRRSAVKQLVTGLGGALVWPRAPLAAQRDQVPRIRGVAPMHTARAAHTATPLADGRVLVAGGFMAEEGRVAGCEVFTPGAATWTTLPGGGRGPSAAAWLISQ